MDQEVIQRIIDASDRLVYAVSLDFRRYLSSKIDWNDKLICIKGPKSAGKTTLILQHIKDAFGVGSGKAVYFALDHILFSEHDPLDAIEYFYSHGWTHLFIDEVHHFKEWSKLIKTATDFYPGLNITYSGSSILKLGEGQADLLRRQSVYNMKGMSFREFLSYEGIVDLPSFSLEEVLHNHRRIALDICSRVKILQHFQHYLSNGYYPFYKEAVGSFVDRLVGVVNTVLMIDLPAVEGVTPPTVRCVRRDMNVKHPRKEILWSMANGYSKSAEEEKHFVRLRTFQIALLSTTRPRLAWAQKFLSGYSGFCIKGAIFSGDIK